MGKDRGMGDRKVEIDRREEWELREQVRTTREDAARYRALPEALRRLLNTPQGEVTLLALLGPNGDGSDRGKGKGTYWEGRRALAKELGDKGLLTEQRVALEILFLLPEEFVKFYEELFHKALAGGEGSSVMHGRTGGLGKAKGSTGIRTGSDVGTQASSSGKRWKNLGLVVRSETALATKRRVDQGLQALMVGEMEELRRDSQGAQSSVGSSGAPGTPSVIRQPRCPGESCRRFLQAGWRYCPSCGAGVS